MSITSGTAHHVSEFTWQHDLSTGRSNDKGDPVLGVGGKARYPGPPIVPTNDQIEIVPFSWFAIHSLRLVNVDDLDTTRQRYAGLRWLEYCFSFPFSWQQQKISYNRKFARPFRFRFIPKLHYTNWATFNHPRHRCAR